MFRVSLSADDFVHEKEIDTHICEHWNSVKFEDNGRPRRLRSMLIRKKERAGSLNRHSKYKFVGDAERDLDREKYRKVFRNTADTHCAASQHSYVTRRDA